MDVTGHAFVTGGGNYVQDMKLLLAPGKLILSNI